MYKQLLSLMLIVLLWSGSQAMAQHNDLLQSGPMLGYVEMQEANLWIQTTKATEYEIKYWKKEDSDKQVKSVKGTTDPETSNTAHIKLNDLDYGTTYSYELYLDGLQVSLPYETEFTTQELWQWRTDAPDFTIAMGSCLYVNDTPYDRPGDPYGKDTGILKRIHEQNPDIMLWLGDNIYYREPDFYSKSRMDYRYKDARKLNDLQPLLAGAINIATWDDHDYGPNNSDRSYRMRSEALEIFKRYWINPGYGIEGTNGVFTKYKYSDVEFFLLDNRYHRAPNKMSGDNKDYLGEAQLQWLMDSLVSSNATFKFIVSGNQVTNKMHGPESMYAFGKEYDQLMTFLEEEQVSGIIFLSGDRHFSELLKTERKDAYPIYEFTSSPLASGVYKTLDQSEEYKNPQRIDGSLIHKDQNFGIINVSGRKGERILTMQTYDSNGDQKWQYKIEESDLQNRSTK